MPEAAAAYVASGGSRLLSTYFTVWLLAPGILLTVSEECKRHPIQQTFDNYCKPNGIEWKTFEV